MAETVSPARDRPTPPRKPTPVGLAGLLGLVGLLGLAGSGPSAAQEERFSDRLAVTELEVSVQVLVKGDPVRGLTAEDFLVRVEGEERPVAGFEVVDLSRTTEPAAGATIHSMRWRPRGTGSPVPAGRGRRGRRCRK